MGNTDTPKTVISEDVEISGTVKCASSIQFDGKLIGDLSCAGNASIGTSANIKGNISVDSAVVLGQITGNISAKDRVELKSSARMNGDVKAKRLIVEDGVTFVGKSEVNPSGVAVPKPAADTKATDADKAQEEQRSSSRDDGGKSGGFFGRR